MKAKVIVGDRESELFDVLVGVKQGCVLAPVIFNLFLVAVTLACRNGLPTMLEFHMSTVWMAVSLTGVD